MRALDPLAVRAARERDTVRTEAGVDYRLVRFVAEAFAELAGVDQGDLMRAGVAVAAILLAPGDLRAQLVHALSSAPVSLRRSD